MPRLSRYSQTVRNLRQAKSALTAAAAFPPRIRRTRPCAGAATEPKCLPADNASAWRSSKVSHVSHWLALSITSQSTSRCLGLLARADPFVSARGSTVAGLPSPALVPRPHCVSRPSSLPPASSPPLSPINSRRETLCTLPAPCPRLPLSLRRSSTPYGRDPRSPPRKRYMQLTSQLLRCADFLLAGRSCDRENRPATLTEFSTDFHS